MNNVTKISVISTAEAALRKLKKENIGVYGCKKVGAACIIAVNDKDIKKVFAIFAKPCYNVKVVKHSKIHSLLSRLTLRAGLVIGCIAFIAAAIISDSFLLKIEVSGSGSYLEPEVRRIVYDEGAKEFKPYTAFNKSRATGRILALPQVTFCNFERRGSVLIVDVQVNEEHFEGAKLSPLISDRDGIVRNIVAVCGTPAVQVGDGVQKGGVLIYAHTLAGEEQVDCLAAGYAELECSKRVEFFASAENEDNLKAAYSSVLLEEEQILSRKHTVKPTEGGVIYVIDFTYLHKLSINLS